MSGGKEEVVDGSRWKVNIYRKHVIADHVNRDRVGQCRSGVITMSEGAVNRLWP